VTILPKFKDLGLSKDMIHRLHEKGFEEPTPIQQKTIPFILHESRDLIAKAQTGTGKTGAFGISIIEKTIPQANHVQSIILTPTRELAIQVTEELNSFSLNQKIRISSIYGGQPIERQVNRLARGVDIVVGTPGRILDHLKRATLDISKVDHVILDEADEMLNMGFVEDIEVILSKASQNRRTILFSATMPSRVEKLAKKYMKQYEVISSIVANKGNKNIEQIYFEVAQADKFEALFRIIDVEESFYGMVFCRTKIDADEIASKLFNRSCRSEAIHGDLSQGQREKVLQKFRNKKINILVATDVAARGIDIDDLTHVINYSLPQDPESYVHRIGRTGRAGKSGTAITLITPSEYRKLISIQKVANTKITKQKVPNPSEIVNCKKQRIRSKISEIINQESFGDHEIVAKEILNQSQDPIKVVAALLKMSFNDELNMDSYSIIDDISAYKKNKDFYYDDRGTAGYHPIGNSGKRGYIDRKGTARLFIAKGKSDIESVKELVNFIHRETKVEKSHIDDVKMFDNFSFFVVPYSDAQKVLKYFQKISCGKKSIVSMAKKKKESKGSKK
jgi:ATP-dependent RNA helicase DeaD|tara:strand:- start:5439 stop:7130 length:1692 start_codon:yes stop_codon:yes gene_type:complete